MPDSADEYSRERGVDKGGGRVQGAILRRVGATGYMFTMQATTGYVIPFNDDVFVRSLLCTRDQFHGSLSISID